jgi:hypothetical protein
VGNGLVHLPVQITHYLIANVLSGVYMGLRPGNIEVSQAVVESGS